MAVEREMFLECEVKRRRVSAKGGYEPFWKVKPIAEALVDEDTEFRCMSCGGAVKVFKRRSTRCTGGASGAQAKERLGALRCGTAFFEGYGWPFGSSFAISGSLRFREYSV